MSIIIKNVSEKKEITILKKYAYGKCGRDYSKIDNYIKSIVLRRKDGEFDFCTGDKSLNLKTSHQTHIRHYIRYW